MKNISRRNLIGITGMSAIGSLIGTLSISKLPGRTNPPCSKLKIIVVGAHPVDPECGCGGTIAFFTAEGHEVVSAYLTRGEAGVQGKSYEEAAHIRSEEAYLLSGRLTATEIIASARF
jgi:GlcNAc-PI de-N-acetylase